MKKMSKTVSCLVIVILSLTMCVQSTTAFAENMPEDVPTYSREDDLLGISPNIPDISFVPSYMARSEEEAPALYEETPVTLFRAENLSPQTVTDLDYTDWWYSPWEDCHYLFLPATADRSSLTITYETDNGSALYLNGTAVTSGNMTSLLSETDEFQVTVGSTDCGTLKIMQSNLGCIYLSTSHGGLDALDMDGRIVETGSILILNAEGGTEYSGEMEHLKSHGNSSWDYSQKKPYNLKLPKKTDLYGMGKAKKWALLGNYLDHSMFRNAVTFEMSRAAGMDTVMDYVFVDLYADGSYRGTYQLTERVQIQKNRVNIRDLEEETEKLNDRALDEYTQIVSGAEHPWDYIENSYKYYDIPNNPADITGGYLLQFQLWNRYGGKVQSGFITSRGQTIDISEPEYASEAQVTYIRNFVQELEDAIYSETGYNAKGKHY
ncbi:MAG: CotH kinase family protein, partial [Oscillospiraceae bacterium]|nr:CotH kinase family protein [Oscillospiraceae bacterium]